MLALIFRPATLADVPALVTLVNQAYRPTTAQTGWTHEARLVAGARANAAQITELLTTQHARLLLACYGDAVQACIHLQASAGICSISLFAVQPAMQGQGVGKQLLAIAEQFAIETMHCNTAEMWVVTARTELLDFYKRRGYQQTQSFEMFPSDAGFGQPYAKTLQLVKLYKPLTPHHAEVH